MGVEECIYDLFDAVKDSEHPNLNLESFGKMMEIINANPRVVDVMMKDYFVGILCNELKTADVDHTFLSLSLIWNMMYHSDKVGHFLVEHLERFSVDISQCNNQRKKKLILSYYHRIVETSILTSLSDKNSTESAFKYIQHLFGSKEGVIDALKLVLLIIQEERSLCSEVLDLFVDDLIGCLKNDTELTHLYCLKIINQVTASTDEKLPLELRQTLQKYVGVRLSKRHPLIIHEYMFLVNNLLLTDIDDKELFSEKSFKSLIKMDENFIEMEVALFALLLMEGQHLDLDLLDCFTNHIETALTSDQDLLVLYILILLDKALTKDCFDLNLVHDREFRQCIDRLRESEHLMISYKSEHIFDKLQ